MNPVFPTTFFGKLPRDLEDYLYHVLKRSRDFEDETDKSQVPCIMDVLKSEEFTLAYQVQTDEYRRAEEQKRGSNEGEESDEIRPGAKAFWKGRSPVYGLEYPEEAVYIIIMSNGFPGYVWIFEGDEASDPSDCESDSDIEDGRVVLVPLETLSCVSRK
jgi:hypothetical protein